MRSVLIIAISLLAAAPAFAEPLAEPAHSHLEDISRPDPHKVFNIDKAFAHRNVPGTFNGSKNAVSKEFYIPQKFAAKTYDTRDFGGKKESWFASLKFWAKDASVKGRYEIPNAGQAAAVKAAPTKDARESGKIAAVRELPDAHRPFRGKESEKLANAGRKSSASALLNANDPNAQPRLTNELHELKTIEDVKALLNKN